MPVTPLRALVLVGSSWVAATGCDEAVTVPFLCDGTRLDVGGHPFCVYRGPDVPAETTCPPLAPAAVRLDDGSLVCADRDLSPCELPREICDLVGSCCNPADADAIDAAEPTDGSTPPTGDGGSTPDADGLDLGASDAGPSDAGAPDDAGPVDAGCSTTATIDGEAIEDTEIRLDTCGGGSMQSFSTQPTFASSYGFDDCTPMVHALLRFDHGEVPASANVTSASVRLFLIEQCASDSGGCGGRFESMFWQIALQPFVRPWVASEATWLAASAGTPWGEGGATHGSDVLRSSSHRIYPSDGAGRWLELDKTADVRAWMDGRRENLGWLIASVRLGSVRHAVFASSEAEADRRPELVVTYDSPCAGP